MNFVWEKKIFLLFDSVHLLKCIRNNWLNQAETNQTFNIPSFDDTDNKLYCASLLHLKKLYNIEQQHSIKIAPALSKKVLYPTSLERQNVSTAVKLFDEKTVAALHVELKENKTGYGETVRGTKYFIEIILKWWSIVNVKHPRKGLHLADPNREPVFSINDDKIKFLENFCTWLIKWNGDDRKKSGKTVGRLTRETYHALKHTTTTFIQLSDYLLKNLKFQYVLYGKFQTDNLEARFGQYRQMSGANYHISLTQALESEKKLQLISWMKLNSSKNGEFTIKTLQTDNDDLDNSTECSTEKFNEIISFSQTFKITEKDMRVLIYIGGYVARKVSNKTNCSKCKNILHSDKHTNDGKR
ncbi:uncharacterized protein LOC118186362 [Stegodyphus dumicola]|uniref:uncharacterized protein LOC118186362 n=1 Tax=Stegodyphus dumicola TaxID=202533 RepID=UPI0015AD0EEB|nr:uncharacterized protein LOC118186362 [Stegodyphus dumicola]